VHSGLLLLRSSSPAGSCRLVVVSVALIISLVLVMVPTVLVATVEVRSVEGVAHWQSQI
jgi:hypothetical protein